MIYTQNRVDAHEQQGSERWQMQKVHGLGLHSYIHTKCEDTWAASVLFG